MRECMYCGKQLEKGEVCSCAMSVAKRREREAAKEAEPKTKKEEKEADRKKKEQERKQKKERRESERAARQSARASYARNAAPGANLLDIFKNVWQLIKDFIRSPIETVMNPGRMGKPEIFILVAIEGLICGLCSFSIITGASRGPFSFLGNILGFRGMAGYSVLSGWAFSALSGAIGGIVIFFLYSGIFFLVNKFIFRGFISYWDFIRRFAFVAVPIGIVGIVGIVLGMFSQHMFLLLLLAGVAGTVVLTYELLRSVWHSQTPAKVMYVMLLCLFLFMMIITSLIRASM